MEMVEAEMDMLVARWGSCRATWSGRGQGNVMSSLRYGTSATNCCSTQRVMAATRADANSTRDQTDAPLAADAEFSIRLLRCNFSVREGVAGGTEAASAEHDSGLSKQAAGDHVAQRHRTGAPYFNCEG